MSSHRAAQILLGLAASILAGVAWAHPVWFADRQQLWRLETDGGPASPVSNLHGVRRIAADASDGSVWLATRRVLHKLDAAGAQVVERRAHELGVDEIREIALNPYDRSLWLLGEHDLVRLSADGAAIERYRLRREAYSLALAPDESIWLMSAHGLLQFKPGAGQTSEIPVREVSDAWRRGLLLDSMGDAAFVGGARVVKRVRLASAEEPRSVRAPGTIRGVAFDPRAGRLWLLVRDPHDAAEREARHREDDDDEEGHGREEDEADERGARFSVLGYDRELNLVKSSALGDLDGSGELVWDARNARLWAVGKRRIVALDGDGNLLSTYTTERRVRSLGAAPFMLQPTLALIRPPENALTNNPTPNFTVGYGADCSGIACGFPYSVFSTYGLEATLNEQVVGSLFRFDSQTGETSYTPSARLPEGVNRFSAQAIDRYAHRSNAVSSTFTVDTIPPKFLTLSPADGAIVTSANATISGSVDEPGTKVVLENHAALGGLGVNPRGTSFSFAVILQPGLNTLTLSENAQQLYVPMLQALRDRLPQIVASFSEPRTFMITSGVGEYAIKRTEANGRTYLYLINFQQGSDGVWRLESM